MRKGFGRPGEGPDTDESDDDGDEDGYANGQLYPDLAPAHSRSTSRVAFQRHADPG